MTWNEAHKYCRDNYLSTINKEEAEMLSVYTDYVYPLNWVGLYRSSNNPENEFDLEMRGNQLTIGIAINQMMILWRAKTIQF